MSEVEPDLEAGVAAASAKLEADPKAAATAAAVTPPPQNVEEETPRLQWEFVRKVYAVILLQYWLAGGILAVICFVPAVPRFFTSPHVAVYIAFIAVLVAPLIALWPMLKYREKHPVNLLLLGLVTLCFSLSIGILTSIFTSIGTTVLQSVILTEVAMINLIIYTFWAAIRNYEVTFLCPFLITHLLTFVVYMTIQVICPLGDVNMTVFGCLATMLFVAFIIHDIVLLIKRHKYKEHIFAAISLYSDLINLALSCLSPSKSLIR
ncbi:unnamed protein product [Urochloa decumbens]|uniref:Uncharacterized protein n=1 Tax=Urochloa decumbens TaxID=240449 RepID=A0ABC9G7A4_9POAL